MTYAILQEMRSSQEAGRHLGLKPPHNLSHLMVVEMCLGRSRGVCPLVKTVGKRPSIPPTHVCAETSRYC